MNFFQAIFLGLVQALTEYLPVSSSAHIRIVGDLMIGRDPGAAFTAIIQIGTELAVILYYRRDIIRILGSWFGSLFGKEGKDWKSRLGAHNRDTQMGWFIIIGTLPILVAGLLFKDVIETTLRNLWITVTVLALFGVLLWVFDSRSKQIKTMDDMTAKDALIFGVGQMLALIPGVSRSGGTITFGRAIGAFPGWGATIAATIVAFFIGYIVIIAFLKFVSSFSYKAFAIYRIVLAVIVALLLIAGKLPAIDPSMAG